MEKKIYTQPLCQVIEIEVEGTLCASGLAALEGTGVNDAPFGEALWE